MDIQTTAATNSTAVALSSERAGSPESVEAERREAADSVVERSEPEASATSPGVGEQVDIRA